MRRAVTTRILLVVVAGLFAWPVFAQEEEDFDLTDEFAFLEEDKVVEAAARGLIDPPAR